jgi:hypothetical protein
MSLIPSLLLEIALNAAKIAFYLSYFQASFVISQAVDESTALHLRFLAFNIFTRFPMTRV